MSMKKSYKKLPVTYKKCLIKVFNALKKYFKY